MSIKTVVCPRCGTSMNVAASMASTKCQSCGNVFPITAAGASPAAAQVGRQSGSQPSRTKNESDGGAKATPGQWIVVGGVAAAALIGLILLTVLRTGGGDDVPAEKPEVPMRTQASVVEDLDLKEGETPTFRVVNLPESTRQSIYRDYKRMIESSFGSTKKIPKSGVAGQSLNKMLGSTVDRDVTQMALIHKISEEDIAQIYAEGEAKGW
ncbi:MAG: hypothetical protein KDB00_04995 [Planctomycetales bacterium]|nr:hypothetical protein [Planctomycetales bacterium]